MHVPMRFAEWIALLAFSDCALSVHGTTRHANWFQTPELPSPIDALRLDSNAATLKRELVTTDPLAVCNDGTQAVYYFSQGDPLLWLISLEGGGWFVTASRGHLSLTAEPLCVQSE